MRRSVLLLLSLLPLLTAAQETKKPGYVLVIHGGAGSVRPSSMSPEMEKAYLSGLEAALGAGEELLRNGGKAVDAVEAVVKILEDDSLYNAGKGAVFTHDGRNELDAAIMDGSTLAAGAVAGITNIRNPVSAARAVMEKSPHVMMTGPGAEQFAADNGLTVVQPAYFFTTDRWNNLWHARKSDSLKELKQKDHKHHHHKSFLKQPEQHDYKYGTVGAVALDRQGNLAAATSTGGMTNKRSGRVGDAPIIGAGTYADNKTCAVSCTGWGEYFIRLVLAKAVSDRMELAGQTLKQASRTMIYERLADMDGDGGLIAVDKDGNIAMPFNTSGMYRGYVKEGGKRVVKIYKD